MKKCPFCAGELEDTVIICHHCGKWLNIEKASNSFVASNSVKKKFRFSDTSRRINFILILVAFLSFFFPFATLQMPIMGSNSVSGFGILLETFNLQNKKQISLGNKNLKMNIKTFKYIKSVKKKLNEKPIYRVILVGLFCGILTYIFLIPIMLLLLLKKPLLSFIVSVFNFVFSVYFMVSLFLVDNLMQDKISSSIKGLENSSFAGLVQAFATGIKIEPAIAVYLLILTALFISILSWLEIKYH